MSRNRTEGGAIHSDRAAKSAAGVVGHAVGAVSEALQGRKAEKRLGQPGTMARRPKRKEAASRWRDSMGIKRQNNQLRLAFGEETRSEAPQASGEGSETLTAKRMFESPARAESE